MMSNATGVSVWAVWGRPVLAAAGLSSPKYAPPPPSWIRGTVGSSAGGGRGEGGCQGLRHPPLQAGGWGRGNERCLGPQWKCILKCIGFGQIWREVDSGWKPR